MRLRIVLPPVIRVGCFGWTPNWEANFCVLKPTKRETARVSDYLTPLRLLANDGARNCAGAPLFALSLLLAERLRWKRPELDLFTFQPLRNAKNLRPR